MTKFIQTTFSYDPIEYAPVDAWLNSLQQTYNVVDFRMVSIDEGEEKYLLVVAKVETL